MRVTTELCDDLKADGEQLWRDIESYRVLDDEAEERYRRIVDGWSLATRMITLEVHDRDNVRAAKEAYETVVNRYAQ